MNRMMSNTSHTAPIARKTGCANGMSNRRVLTIPVPYETTPVDCQPGMRGVRRCLGEGRLTMVTLNQDGVNRITLFLNPFTLAANSG